MNTQNPKFPKITMSVGLAILIIAVLSIAIGYSVGFQLFPLSIIICAISYGRYAIKKKQYNAYVQGKSIFKDAMKEVSEEK